jgi:hypothetical protein
MAPGQAQEKQGLQLAFCDRKAITVLKNGSGIFRLSFFPSLCRLLVVGFFLALCPPATTWAQLNASIDGQVRDARMGAPIMGVRVTLAGTGKRAVTDGSGRFLISEIPPGSYQLWLVGTGYLPIMKKIERAPAQLFHLDLSLEAEAVSQVQQPIIRSRPVAPDRIKFTALGGLGYMSVGDYNKHVGTQTDFAESRLADENIILLGDKFHRGYTAEIEARYNLSPRLALGLGVGWVDGKGRYSRQATSGQDRYRLNRKFSATALPVGFAAYAVYPVRAQSFYLGFGLSRVFAQTIFDDTRFREALSVASTLSDSTWTEKTEMSASGWGSVLRGGFEARLGKHVTLNADCLVRWAPISGFTGTRTRGGDDGTITDDVKLIFRSVANSVVGTANYLEVVSASHVPSVESTTREGNVDFSGIYLTVGAAISF